MATATWDSYVLSGRFRTKRRRTQIRKTQEEKQRIRLTVGREFKELKFNNEETNE